MSGAVRFSANLGFLWTDRELPAAVQAAADAGFELIELHQPFHVPADELAATINDLGLQVISMNTGVGDADLGELGLAAIPGREVDARALLDEAIDYAAVIGAKFVSVVVGRTGQTEAAELTLQANLAYGANRAKLAGIGLLIEPLNTQIADDLHIVRVTEAVETIKAVGADNIFVMADTFHVMTMEGSLDTIAECIDYVGHIQISGWPDRGEPDQGIDFVTWIPGLHDAGYEGVFGAEYRPRNTTDDGLSWLARWNHGGSQ